MSTTIYGSYTWANGEEGGTPINATNLNHMETGIKNATDGVIALESKTSDIESDISEINTKINNLGNIDVSASDIQGLQDALDNKIDTSEKGVSLATLVDGKIPIEQIPEGIEANVTKASIGLGNVDNTSDLNKPISTATQSAIDNLQEKINGNSTQIANLGINKLNNSLLGVSNGIATLDSNCKLNASQFPEDILNLIGSSNVSSGVLSTMIFYDLAGGEVGELNTQCTCNSASFYKFNGFGILSFNYTASNEISIPLNEKVTLFTANNLIFNPNDIAEFPFQAHATTNVSTTEAINLLVNIQNKYIKICVNGGEPVTLPVGTVLSGSFIYKLSDSSSTIDGTEIGGEGSKQVSLNDNGHLIITFDDGSSVDLGKISFKYSDLTDEEKAELKPSISVIETETGHNVKIDNVTFDVMNGVDGTSVTASVTEIDGGHTVSFTDVNGIQSFDVMDGTSAEGGSGSGNVTFETCIPPTITESDIISTGDDYVQIAIPVDITTFGQSSFVEIYYSTRTLNALMDENILIKGYVVSNFLDAKNVYAKCYPSLPTDGLTIEKIVVKNITDYDLYGYAIDNTCYSNTDGADGADGVDGVSPTVTLTKDSNDVATAITVTNADGTTDTASFPSSSSSGSSSIDSGTHYYRSTSDTLVKNEFTYSQCTRTITDHAIPSGFYAIKIQLFTGSSFYTCLSTDHVEIKYSHSTLKAFEDNNIVRKRYLSCTLSNNYYYVYENGSGGDTLIVFISDSIDISDVIIDEIVVYSNTSSYSRRFEVVDNYDSRANEITEITNFALGEHGDKLYTTSFRVKDGVVYGVVNATIKSTITVQTSGYKLITIPDSLVPSRTAITNVITNNGKAAFMGIDAGTNFIFMNTTASGVSLVGDGVRCLFTYLL